MAVLQMEDETKTNTAMEEFRQSHNLSVGSNYLQLLHLIFIIYMTDAIITFCSWLILGHLTSPINPIWGFRTIINYWTLGPGPLYKKNWICFRPFNEICVYFFIGLNWSIGIYRKTPKLSAFNLTPRESKTTSKKILVFP